VHEDMSGYQAARWDGRQALLYGRSSTIRIQADVKLTLGGQQRLLDRVDVQHLGLPRF
jgi:hypothetical protein